MKKGHLVAYLHQYIKKWLFKALFAHLCLADTQLTAPRTDRQIEAMALVFWCIQKNLTLPLRESSFWVQFEATPR